MFQFSRYDTLTLSALVGLVTSTFYLLTMKLVRVVVRWVGNLITNFGVSETFRSRLMNQHLSDAPRDLAT